MAQQEAMLIFSKLMHQTGATRIHTNSSGTFDINARKKHEKL